MTTYARITGTGSYLPQKVLTNRDLEAVVETSDEWIVSRTGIRERHVAAEGEFASDLALHACRNALAAAGRTSDDIDLIIVATSTPDMVFPSSACLLQAKLGVTGGAAFDVQAVCSGFVYALATADASTSAENGHAQMRASVTRRRGLLAHPRLEGPRHLRPLSATAPATVVLEASGREPGILSSHLRADGSHVRRSSIRRATCAAARCREIPR